MKKTLTFLLPALLFSISLIGQDGLHLRVRMRNYRSDTLWLGYSYGRRAVPQFAAVKTGRDTFEITLETAPKPGEYAIVYEPTPGAKKQFISILLPAGIHQLDVDASPISSTPPPAFPGSPENELFAAYRDRLNQLREARNDRNNEWRLLHDEPSLISLEAADKAMVDYQTTFITEHPGTLGASIAEAARYSIPPAPKKNMTWQKRADYRQNWYKQHFLDHTDITSERFWHSPEALEWLDQFTFKLCMPGPDSARWYAEETLRRLEPNPEAFHYYFNYMLNSYEGMSRFYYDEMYIYLVRNYVEQGKTPWYTPNETIDKSDKAKNIERLLVGKKIPEATLYTQTEEPKALYDIEAPYLLLIFFQPDCSHCKKETELIKRLYDKYRDRGFKVVMVCGKPTDQLDLCWKYRVDYAFPEDWLLLADGKSKSRYKSLFNLQSYPRIFLLNHDKTILFRRSGEASEMELDKVFDSQMIK